MDIFAHRRLELNGTVDFSGLNGTVDLSGLNGTVDLSELNGTVDLSNNSILTVNVQSSADLYNNTQNTTNGTEIGFPILFNGTSNLTGITPEINATTATSKNSTSTHYNDSQTLRNTFTVYGSLFLAILVVFCWARLRFPRTYNLRKANNEVQVPKYFHRFSPVSPGLQTHLANDQFGSFSWYWKLFTISDETFVDECGMDHWAFIRICNMGYRLAFMGVVVSVFLLPLYKTAEEPSNPNDVVTDIVVEITTGNLVSGSPRLIATVIGAYLVFLHAMYVVLQELEVFTKMRHRFLKKAKARNYAVYLRNIPVGFRSNRGMRNFFEKSLHGIKVEDARIALTTSHLRRDVAERAKTIQLLEHAVAEADENGEAPTHKVDGGLFSGVRVPGRRDDEEKVDSIEYYTEELKNQNKKIAEQIDKLEEKAREQPDDEQFEDESESSPLKGSANDDENLLRFLTQNTTDVVKNAVKNTYAMTNEATALVNKARKEASNLVGVGNEHGAIHSAGFITFRTLSTANAALQMTHHEKPFYMEVLEAPDPDDVLWGSVGLEHRQLQMGRLTSFGASGAICLLWTIPISFVASISSVQGLRDTFDWVAAMLDAAPWLGSVLGVLAPQFLVILNALLPVILEFITKFEGAISGSLVEASLFVKLASFTIIQTFFITALSKGILQDLHRLLNNPSGIVSLLATSLPAQSTFFMQLVFVRTTTTFLMEGLGIVRIIMGIARKYVGPNLTDRERRMPFLGLQPLSEPQDFRHAVYLSGNVLLFMVYFVYAVIAPLVSFIIGFCFLMLEALFRHQFVYIYAPQPDSGGHLWMNFIRVITTCFLIAELTIAGLMSLKGGAVAVPLMIPLIVITVLFSMYIRERHFTVATHLPTRLCLQQDQKTRHSVDFGFLKNAYLQPEMREKESVPKIPEERLRKLGFCDEEEELDRSPPDSTMEVKTSDGNCRVTKLTTTSDDVFDSQKSESDVYVDGDACTNSRSPSED